MADPGIETSGGPLADIVAEASRLLDAAEAQGVVLRLIGGSPSICTLTRCPHLSRGATATSTPQL